MNSALHDENERLDSALRAIGTVMPEPGIEGRILTRLAAERMAAHSLPVQRRWSRYAFPALGMATAGLACAGILVGSVSHSRAGHAGHMAPPVLSLPGNGVGAASAVHPAAPVTTPVPASAATRGRSTRTLGRGRARIAPQTRKANGVIVPSPAPNPQY